MQRQAVPLIRTESPIVGTGMEYRAAKFGVCSVCKRDGVVKFVAADRIVVSTGATVKISRIDKIPALQPEYMHQSTTHSACRR